MVINPQDYNIDDKSIELLCELVERTTAQNIESIPVQQFRFTHQNFEQEDIQRIDHLIAYRFILENNDSYRPGIKAYVLLDNDEHRILFDDMQAIINLVIELYKESGGEERKIYVEEINTALSIGIERIKQCIEYIIEVKVFKEWDVGVAAYVVPTEQTTFINNIREKIELDLFYIQPIKPKKQKSASNNASKKEVAVLSAAQLVYSAWPTECRAKSSNRPMATKIAKKLEDHSHKYFKEYGGEPPYGLKKMEDILRKNMHVFPD